MKNKVGIIIPIYNSEKYLAECVESAIRQSYKNIKIYLIDDGSSDGSSNICDAYGKNDPRVKVVHLKNNGVSHARNTGIKEAYRDKCDYVLFLDSDDYIKENTVEKLLQYISDDTITGVSVNRFDTRRETILCVGEYDVNDFIQKLFSGKTYGYVFPYIFDIKQIVGCNISFNEKISYLEDMHFLISYLMVTGIKRVSYIESDPSYFYRINDSSVTMSRNVCRVMDNIFAALDEIQELTNGKYSREILNSKICFLERKIELDNTLDSLDYSVNSLKGSKGDFKLRNMNLRSRIVYLVFGTKNKKMVRLFFRIKHFLKRGGES